MRPRLLALLLALSALVGALALAGCGDDDGGDEDVATLLEQTFGGSASTKSGKIDLNVAADLQGLTGISGPIALRLTGPYESEEGTSLPRFDLALTAELMGQSFSAGANALGDKGFLKFQGTTYEVPAQVFTAFREGFEQAQEQTKGEDDRGSTPLAALGIDPTKWLRDPERKGEEEVGGAETIHIAAGVDVERLLADIDELLGQADRLGLQDEGEAPLPEELSDQDRKELAEAVETATFDVWTGKDDKILRQIAVKLKLAVPEAQRQGAGGLENADIDLRFTISDVNEEQDISEPGSARPLEELLAQLAPLLGLAGIDGGVPGGTGAGEDEGATAPQGSEDYTRCLNEAGSDIAEAQKCADLLER